MEVRNAGDLWTLEQEIKSLLSKYDLDTALWTLGQRRELLNGDLPDETAFIIAGFAMFALRFCTPPIMRNSRSISMEEGDFRAAKGLVSKYLLADPISFSASPQNNSPFTSTMLRLVGNQFTFSVTFWGQPARALHMFSEIPKRLSNKRELKSFDFNGSFQDLNGVSLDDFALIGTASYAAANSSIGFTGGWFVKAREQGLTLPDQQTVIKVMDILAGDQWQHHDTYEKYRQENRDFAAYNFNSLYVYPLIRPWRKTLDIAVDEDRYIAPLPDLILARLTDGIYEQLREKYKKKFSDAFGLIFEEYVGDVLKNSINPKFLLTESDVRKTYRSRQGKTPDFVAIEGKRATFFECKTLRFSRKALALGDEQAINNTLKELVEGLLQLVEFQQACREQKVGNKKLNDLSEINLVVVTFGQLHLINSAPFRDEISKRLSEKLGLPTQSLPRWQVLSLSQLEAIQPHISAGGSLAETVNRLSAKQFNEVLKELHERTGATFENSFLYPEFMRLFERLGVPS